jgi:hypothetical protein
MADDASFGKFVRISANTSELLVTGVRLYSFSVGALLPQAQTNSTQCLTKQDFPSSFYPSRFAFAGDDWSSVSGGLPIEISVNEESINVVLQAATDSRDPDLTARRYVLKSTPGSEFAFADGISSIRQCALGTFSPTISFSPCQPCPFGSYQNVVGSLSCIACPETAYCPIGSVLAINGSGITVNVSTPRFTTAQGDGPDSVIWSQLLPPNIYGWFLWVIWLLLVLLGFWVQQKWECTARARPYQEKVAKTLESMDPEPIEYFDGMNRAPSCVMFTFSCVLLGRSLRKRFCGARRAKRRLVLLSSIGLLTDCLHLHHGLLCFLSPVRRHSGVYSQQR